ncbi:MAG: DUF2240 family protein [Methermicoccaceae archaeon]
MDDARYVIASLFRQAGQEEMSKGDMVLALSIDLQWCTPEKAKEFIENTVQMGLLKDDNDTLSPEFDISQIEIPIGYTPDEKAFMAPDLFERVLVRLERKLSRQQAIAKINALQERFSLLDADVVALILAKQMGIAIDDLIEEDIKQRLETFNTQT